MQNKQTKNNEAEAERPIQAMAQKARKQAKIARNTDGCENNFFRKKKKIKYYKKRESRHNSEDIIPIVI